MGFVRRSRGLWLALAGIAIGQAFLGGQGYPGGQARAQFAPTSRFQFSESVSLNTADSATRTHLLNVEAFLADQQWDEAVETLRLIMESSGDRVIEFAPRRYISLRDYCHLQIAALPPPALAMYRASVDPQARRWYDEALASGDAELLLQVVEQHFCSSRADEALLRLGDIALEEGDPGRARAWWAKMLEWPPEEVSAEIYDRVRGGLEDGSDDALLLDRCYVQETIGLPPIYKLQDDMRKGLFLPDEDRVALVRFWKSRRLPAARRTYPGSDVPPADVEARLVLASILEGSSDRARAELARYASLYPDTTGRLAGREGPYSQLLSSLLEGSLAWPAVPTDDNWPTFGGSPARNKISPETIDLGPVRWSKTLEKVTFDNSAMPNVGGRSRRVAEHNNHNHLLSYHPIVAGGLVYYCTQNQVFAFDLSTGDPAWPSAAGRPSGEIYADKQEGFDQRRASAATFGAPRYTLTVCGDRLLARMGSPITGPSGENPVRFTSSSLVCLDLAAQGRLLWKALPEDEKWAFEGSPVCDGSRVYVALRRSFDVQPQAHVACYDAQTGRPLWRRLVCAAQTPAHREYDECTHGLLTLHRDTLYFNTNLGAVTALSTRDGGIRWLTLYQRAEGGDVMQPAGHLYRDLTPCIYDRGLVFAAPADSEAILALDAETGEVQWTSRFAENTVHMLGVGGGNLIVSGDKLWFINVATGKLRCEEWPEGGTPKAYGRGALLGDRVYFPTHEDIRVFDQATGALLGQPINLITERGTTGGNLVAAEGCLLIATTEKLVAIGEYGRLQRGVHEQDITLRPQAARPRYQFGTP